MPEAAAAHREAAAGQAAATAADGLRPGTGPGVHSDGSVMSEEQRRSARRATGCANACRYRRHACCARRHRRACVHQRIPGELYVAASQLRRRRRQRCVSGARAHAGRRLGARYRERRGDATRAHAGRRRRREACPGDDGCGLGLDLAGREDRRLHNAVRRLHRAGRGRDAEGARDDPGRRDGLPRRVLARRPDDRVRARLVDDDGNESVALELVPATGGKPVSRSDGLLGSLPQGGRISFSPDGKLIAYAGDADNPGIFVVGASTGEPQQLTSDLDSWPVFSEDGTTISFGRDATSENADDNSDDPVELPRRGHLRALDSAGRGRRGGIRARGRLRDARGRNRSRPRRFAGSRAGRRYRDEEGPPLHGPLDRHRKLVEGDACRRGERASAPPFKGSVHSATFTLRATGKPVARVIRSLACAAPRLSLRASGCVPVPRDEHSLA